MAIITAALSSLFTYVIIAMMRKGARLDTPNDRSSHNLPTPTSGGMAIVLSSWFGIAVAIWFGLIPISIMLLGGVLASDLALIGFFDDMFQLGRGSRFIIQVLLVAIGEFSLVMADYLLPTTLLILPFFVAWLWLINLFNFMDGINGIAGVEFVSVCLCVSFFLMNSDMVFEALFCLILIGAVSGFLLWNFPLGKIFMGDSGSYFLGFILGFFWLVTGLLNNVFFAIWAIMLSIFIVDASLTLARRVILGERFLSPHNQHMYQILARRLNSHAKVSLLVLTFNFMWLLPLSYALYNQWIDVTWALSAAYIPLMFFWLCVRIRFEKNTYNAAV